MNTFTLAGYSGHVGCGCHKTHAPDPETIGRAKPATLISAVDCERIFREFSQTYSGIAHGIAKVELETGEDGVHRIVAFVNDWNGVVNIPTLYQGLAVTFTQFVPPGAVFGL